MEILLLKEEAFLCKAGWAHPELVLQMVKEKLQAVPFAVPVVSRLGKIILGSWNMEYLWQAKALHFIDTYKEIIKRHHVLAVQEVSPRGLSVVAEACGYSHFVSKPNSRGQAVGFLIHPSVNAMLVKEYDQLTEVYGVHDLRPALQISLPNQDILLTTVHLKSMCGGMPFSSRIRRKQLELLMAGNEGSSSPGIILGDFNCFLDTSCDTAPLIANGYRIFDPGNHTSTQVCGGRLDGMFYKNMLPLIKLTKFGIHNFWRSSLVGRSLSDHGLLSWNVQVGL